MVEQLQFFQLYFLLLQLTQEPNKTAATWSTNQEQETFRGVIEF